MTRTAALSESHDSCQHCRLRTLCLPDNLTKSDIGKLEGIIQRRKPVSRGASLFQSGQRFHAIYAVRSGAVKTLMPMANGDEHVSGFHLPGEIIGLDAIVMRRHPSSAVALETASLCEFPYSALEALSDRMPALQRQLMRVMSRELLAEQNTNRLLARRSAEQRLAHVLLKFSERFASRGLSARRFRLPMSRLDLGNYLGLVPETMSRTFRRLEEQDMVNIDRKEVEIVDIDAMKSLAFGTEGA